MATAKTILANAKRYLGMPYVWGGDSKAEGGFDCSGYVYNVLRDSGYPIGRSTSQGYSSLGRKVARDQKKQGDLLYFGSSTSKITHIAIYAGDGKMYESIGSSKNKKRNPGKGVTLSAVARRSDLVLVKRIITTGTSQSTDTASGKTGNSTDTGWRGNTAYYMENAAVKEWQAAMNKGFDTKELSVDGKFGKGSQNFARNHLLWRGQKHNCITAIQWLRKTLHDKYGFSKLSETGAWDSYLGTCVGVFQKNRGLKADQIVGLETTWWLLNGKSV